ncbi:MAG: acyl-CoA carboxylase epsilon subunit [Nocardioidaceae bacterium]
MADEQPARATVRIVAGHPTPQELAALVAVLGAASAPVTGRRRTPRSEWASPRRAVREPSASGWRSSGLPR